MKSLMKRIRSNIFSSLFATGSMDTYYKRFIEPERARLRKLGIPEWDIDQLWQLALNTPDPTILGQAPGARLGAFASYLEAGGLVNELINGDDAAADADPREQS